MKHKIRPGGWAWIGLTGYVLVADGALIKSDNSTMSEVFGDALKHPRRRWPVMLAWSLLTLHLFGNLLPRWFEPLKKLDPIGWVARLFGG